MIRSYDSSRRRAAAAQTRRDILQTALQLHGEGITEFAPLARAAACSLPTLRKHFPNKESLFESCVDLLDQTVGMPDVEALDAIVGQEHRLEAGVSELCRFHEAMFGYAWHYAHLRRQSAILDAQTRSYETLVEAIASIITPPGSPKGALIRSLVDALTYRALRLAGDLSPQEACGKLTSMLHVLIREEA